MRALSLATGSHGLVVRIRCSRCLSLALISGQETEILLLVTVGGGHPKTPRIGRALRELTVNCSINPFSNCCQNLGSLCTSAKKKYGDRIMEEKERVALLLCQAKGEQ